MIVKHGKWHLHPAVRTGNQLTLGERAADRMRNAMGSWTFVFAFFGVMILWAVTNTWFFTSVLHHHPFDPYPFILLNLFLSMMAGVQAAALLIAAKRSDAISAEVATHTSSNTDEIRRLLDQHTTLLEAVKGNTDRLDEIHEHLTAIGQRLDADGGSFPPPARS
jgi:uncharacterized membrane protein